MLGLGITLTPGNTTRGATPLSILGSSLLAWWTADRTDLITLSGSQVTSWRDVVAGYDAVQASSGARPVYSATSFNGSPSITADGVDDELTCTSPALLALLPTSGAGEIAVIAEQLALASDTTTRRAVAFGDVTNNARFLSHVGSAGVNVAQMTVGTGASSTAQTRTGFNSRHFVRGISTGSQVSVKLDSSLSSSSAATPSTTNNRVRLFASSQSSASGFWNGRIRDALIISGNLTAAQVTALEAWAFPRRML